MTQKKGSESGGAGEDDSSVDSEGQVDGARIQTTPDLLKGFFPNDHFGNFLLDDDDSNDEVPVDEKSFFFLELHGERRNSSLIKAVRCFNGLVSDLGFQDSVFFKNKKLKLDFQNRLREYMSFIDGSIERLKFTLRAGKNCSNFSDNWEENIRFATYYIFFLHYGEKRKGEVDDDGNPQDYAYHPARAAFENLIQKARFFDEPTMVATFFHDVEENWSRGMIALLSCENSELDSAALEQTPSPLRPYRDYVKANRAEAFQSHFSNVCVDLDGVVGRTRTDSDDICPFFGKLVGIESLVYITTKNTDNRARAILDILNKIAFYPGVLMFSAARALLIKIVDRLDNVQSFMNLILRRKLDQDAAELMFRQMSLDTIYFFLALATALGMWNLVDWLYDYIVFKNPEERKRRASLRRVPEGASSIEKLDLKAVFREKFNAELQRCLGKLEGGERDLLEGRDYILEFRPIGYRYEDPEEASELAQEGGYQMALQNYLVFRVVQPDRNLLWAAREAFKVLFPEPLSAKHAGRGELKSALGRRLMHSRLNVDPQEHGYGPEFGVGVWSVFESPSDLSAKILGVLNLGYFYNNELANRARDRFFEFFAGIKPFVKHLVRQYDFLGRVVTPDSPEALSGEIRSKLDDLPLNLKDISEPSVEAARTSRFFTEGQAKNIEKLLDTLVMTIVMDRPDVVEVEVNGESATVYLPAESDPVYGALVFAAPWALGRKLDFQPVEPKKNRGRRRVAYRVDLNSPFDEKLFSGQIAWLEPVLAHYYAGLLKDDMDVVQSQVFIPDIHDVIERGRRKEQRKKRRRSRSRHKPKTGAPDRS